MATLEMQRPRRQSQPQSPVNPTRTRSLTALPPAPSSPTIIRTNDFILLPSVPTHEPEDNLPSPRLLQQQYAVAARSDAQARRRRQSSLNQVISTQFAQIQSPQKQHEPQQQQQQEDQLEELSEQEASPSIALTEELQNKRIDELLSIVNGIAHSCFGEGAQPDLHFAQLLDDIFASLRRLSGHNAPLSPTFARTQEAGPFAPSDMDRLSYLVDKLTATASTTIQPKDSGLLVTLVGLTNQLAQSEALLQRASSSSSSHSNHSPPRTPRSPDSTYSRRLQHSPRSSLGMSGSRGSWSSIQTYNTILTPSDEVSTEMQQKEAYERVFATPHLATPSTTPTAAVLAEACRQKTTLPPLPTANAYLRRAERASDSIGSLETVSEQLSVDGSVFDMATVRPSPRAHRSTVDGLLFEDLYTQQEPPSSTLPQSPRSDEASRAASIGDLSDTTAVLLRNRRISIQTDSATSTVLPGYSPDIPQYVSVDSDAKHKTSDLSKQDTPRLDEKQSSASFGPPCYDGPSDTLLADEKKASTSNEASSLLERRRAKLAAQQSAYAARTPEDLAMVQSSIDRLSRVMPQLLDQRALSPEEQRNLQLQQMLSKFAESKRLDDQRAAPPSFKPERAAPSPPIFASTHVKFASTPAPGTSSPKLSVSFNESDVPATPTTPSSFASNSRRSSLAAGFGRKLSLASITNSLRRASIYDTKGKNKEKDAQGTVTRKGGPDPRLKSDIAEGLASLYQGKRPSEGSVLESVPSSPFRAIDFSDDTPRGREHSLINTANEEEDSMLDDYSFANFDTSTSNRATEPRSPIVSSPSCSGSGSGSASRISSRRSSQLVSARSYSSHLDTPSWPRSPMTPNSPLPPSSSKRSSKAVISFAADTLAPPPPGRSRAASLQTQLRHDSLNNSTSSNTAANPSSLLSSSCESSSSPSAPAAATASILAATTAATTAIATATLPAYRAASAASTHPASYVPENHLTVSAGGAGDCGVAGGDAVDASPSQPQSQPTAPPPTASASASVSASAGATDSNQTFQDQAADLPPPLVRSLVPQNETLYSHHHHQLNFLTEAQYSLGLVSVLVWTTRVAGYVGSRASLSLETVTGMPPTKKSGQDTTIAVQGTYALVDPIFDGGSGNENESQTLEIHLQNLPNDHYVFLASSSSSSSPTPTSPSPSSPPFVCTLSASSWSFNANLVPSEMRLSRTHPESSSGSSSKSSGNGSGSKSRNSRGRGSGSQVVEKGHVGEGKDVSSARLSSAGSSAGGGGGGEMRFRIPLPLPARYPQSGSINIHLNTAQQESLQNKAREQRAFSSSSSSSSSSGSLTQLRLGLTERRKKEGIERVRNLASGASRASEGEGDGGSAWDFPLSAHYLSQQLRGRGRGRGRGRVHGLGCAVCYHHAHHHHHRTQQQEQAQVPRSDASASDATALAKVQENVHNMVIQFDNHPNDTSTSTKSTTIFRALPSEGWEELVDAWMCHGDQELNATLTQTAVAFSGRIVNPSSNATRSSSNTVADNLGTVKQGDRQESVGDSDGSSEDRRNKYHKKARIDANDPAELSRKEGMGAHAGSEFRKAPPSPTVFWVGDTYLLIPAHCVERSSSGSSAAVVSTTGAKAASASAGAEVSDSDDGGKSIQPNQARVEPEQQQQQQPAAAAATSWYLRCQKCDTVLGQFVPSFDDQSNASEAGKKKQKKEGKEEAKEEAWPSSSSVIKVSKYSVVPIESSSDHGLGRKGEQEREQSGASAAPVQPPAASYTSIHAPASTNTSTSTSSLPPPSHPPSAPSVDVVDAEMNSSDAANRNESPVTHRDSNSDSKSYVWLQTLLSTLTFLGASHGTRKFVLRAQERPKLYQQYQQQQQWEGRDFDNDKIGTRNRDFESNNATEDFDFDGSGDSNQQQHHDSTSTPQLQIWMFPSTSITASFLNPGFSYSTSRGSTAAHAQARAKSGTETSASPALSTTWHGNKVFFRLVPHKSTNKTHNHSGANGSDGGDGGDMEAFEVVEIPSHALQWTMEMLRFVNENLHPQVQYLLLPSLTANPAGGGEKEEKEKEENMLWKCSYLLRPM